MGKPFVFVSYGQCTGAENLLGEKIAAIVRKTTGCDAFIAGQVHDFKGLHTNVLDALRNCSGFIAVMHPRGTVERPGAPPLTRASVWIEQEIAIAAYIGHAEGKSIPVIVFIHESISREGIREFVHANPRVFSSDSEVLTTLPDLLKSWPNLASVRIELESSPSKMLDNQQWYCASLYVTNDSTRPIDKYHFEFSLPARIGNFEQLEKWGWVKGNDRLVLTQNQGDSIALLSPKLGRQRLRHVEYYLTRGHSNADFIEGTIWVDGQESSIKKTFGELHQNTTDEKIWDAVRSISK